MDKHETKEYFEASEWELEGQWCPWEMGRIENPSKNMNIKNRFKLTSFLHKFSKILGVTS
jgi:hypothetical protein